MAERLAKLSDVDEYIAYHFTAAQSDTALDSNMHGTFLKSIVVGTLGTGLVITLGNGTTGTGSNVISKITPTAPGTITFGVALDKGLYLVLAGSSFDVTVVAMDMAV